MLDEPISAALSDRLAIEFAPDISAVRLMVRRLRVDLPVSRVAAMVGASKSMIKQVERGLRAPGAFGARAIWLIHCLRYAPHLLESDVSIVSWGKLSGPPRKVPVKRKVRVPTSPPVEREIDDCEPW